MEAEQVKASLSNVPQTPKSNAIDNVKRESCLFPGKSKMFRSKKYSLAFHGLSPVRLAEKNISQVERTTVTFLQKSANKAAIELSTNLQPFQSHIRPLDTHAGRDLNI